RHVLAGLAHRLERELLFQAWVRKAPAERGVVDRSVAAGKSVLRFAENERSAAHRLDSPGDVEVAFAGRNGMASGDDRGESRSAESVDGHAWNRLGQARQQQGHPSDVPVVFSRLVGGAEVDVLDLGGFDAGPL